MIQKNDQPVLICNTTFQTEIMLPVSNPNVMDRFQPGEDELRKEAGQCLSSHSAQLPLCASLASAKPWVCYE